MAKKHRKQLSEDEALRIAAKNHPQWRKQWERELPARRDHRGGRPADEFPRLHLTVHAIVDRQLAADDPKGVVAIARQLQQLGVSRHEVRHAIGQAVANQLWSMGRERRVFDVDKYFAELHEIVDSYT